MPNTPWYSSAGAGLYLDAGPGAFDSAGEFATDLFRVDLTNPQGEIKEALGLIGATRYRDVLFAGFGGSWWQLREYAFVLDGTADFLDAMHSAMVQNIGGITVLWQGVSANNAQAYFEVFPQGIADARDGCRKASKALSTYLDAVKELASTIGDKVEDLAISVYLIALSLAAGKKLSWVGIVFGGGIIASAIDKWSDINDLIGGMESLVDLLSMADGLATQLTDFTSKLRVPLMEETD